jgi:hypothetical protein
MVDLVHRSAQNLLQEARNLRRIPAPEGEVGREAGKRDLSRRKEEHSAPQMICEAGVLLSKFVSTVPPTLIIPT